MATAIVLTSTRTNRTRTTYTLAALAALAAMFLLWAQTIGAQNYTVIGTVWNDANCDGVRQATEASLPGVTVSLIGQGTDRQMFTTDDRMVEQTGSSTNGGQFRFTRGGPFGDKYAVAIYNSHKPAGFEPAPYQQGSDRTVDNDLYLPVAGSPLWATTAFEMKADYTAIEDIDIGLAPVSACSGGEQPTERDYTIYLPTVTR